MNLKWSVTHSKDYFKVIVDRLKELLNRLDGSRLRSAIDAEMILAEVNDIQEVRKLAEQLVIGQTDPTAVLHLQKDDKGDPVYVMAVGTFRGYYYLDLTNKTGVGVWCEHGRLS